MLAALVFNVVRTVFLTWMVGSESGETATDLHDPAGVTVMIATLLTIVLYALRLARSNDAEGADRGASVTTTTWHSTRVGWVVATAVAVLVLESGIRLWFDREGSEDGAEHWAFVAAPDGWEEHPISEDVLAVMQCSSATQLTTVRTWNGVAGLAMLFRWEEDAAGLSTLTNVHDPRVCMPAIGATLVATDEPIELEVAGRVLAFDAYQFRVDGLRQYVFNAVWDASRREATPRSVVGASLDSERLTRVLRGRRYADRDRVVFVLQDDVSPADAAAWLRRTASAMLRLQDGR